MLLLTHPNRPIVKYKDFLGVKPETQEDIARWFNYVYSGNFPKEYYWDFFKQIGLDYVKTSSDDRNTTGNKYMSLMEERMQEYNHGTILMSGGIDSVTMAAIAVKLGLDYKYIFWDYYLRYHNEPMYQFLIKNFECTNMENITEHVAPEGCMVASPLKSEILMPAVSVLATKIPDWIAEETSELGLDVNPFTCATAMSYKYATSQILVYENYQYNKPVFLFNTMKWYKFKLSHAENIFMLKRKQCMNYIADALGEEIASNTHRNRSANTKAFLDEALEFYKTDGFYEDFR